MLFSCKCCLSLASRARATRERRSPRGRPGKSWACLHGEPPSSRSGCPKGSCSFLAFTLWKGFPSHPRSFFGLEGKGFQGRSPVAFWGIGSSSNPEQGCLGRSPPPAPPNTLRGLGTWASVALFLQASVTQRLYEAPLASRGNWQKQKEGEGNGRRAGIQPQFPPSFPAPE